MEKKFKTCINKKKFVENFHNSYGAKERRISNGHLDTVEVVHFDDVCLKKVKVVQQLFLIHINT